MIVAAYPLMKRVTNWPQAFLGLTFNWGALLGWAAAHGSLAFPRCCRSTPAGAAGPLLYDTMYAHQDKGDDVKVGVKSTALHFGDDTKGYLGTFGGLSIAGLVRRRRQRRRRLAVLRRRGGRRGVRISFWQTGRWTWTTRRTARRSSE